jgi:leucyl aminopeptidase
MLRIALLKGAMDVALGNALTGFFCNNDQLSVKLNEAGKETGDRLWRMPLHPVYKSQIKSDVADLKNVGGRGAGACTAAAFLQSFVGSENKKSKQVYIKRR